MMNYRLWIQARINLIPLFDICNVESSIVGSVIRNSNARDQ